MDRDLMNSCIRIALALSLLLTGMGRTLAESPQPMSDAQAQMSLYLGDWDFQGHGFDSPFGLGADADSTGQIHAEWFPGHASVIRRNVVIDRRGGVHHVLQVLYFDAKAGAYHEFEMTEGGPLPPFDITFSGNKMIARYDFRFGNRTWHIRSTTTLVDSEHRKYLREYSADGVTWAPSWESSETRRQ